MKPSGPSPPLVNTMTGIYPTANKFATQHKKLVRMLTVVGYLLCVSFAAIILTLYYLFLWNPDMSREVPDIQSRVSGELCAPFSENPQRLLPTKSPATSSPPTVVSNSPIYIISTSSDDKRIASEHDSRPTATRRKGAFIPYPAKVARDTRISPISNLPTVRESSLNLQGYKVKNSIQILSATSSDPQHVSGSTESLYEDSKRVSSVARSIENSQEESLTYQDSSALTNSNVSSLEN